MKTSDVQFKVGLFGIGLDAYWPQFPELRLRLVAFIEQVARRLEDFKVHVTNLGLIDSPEKSFWAGHEFRRADVDLIFLYVTTYALSSTVLPAVRRAKVPVIILNLSPGPSIDYEQFNRLGDRTKMTGEWLAYCQACPVPEMANVFSRCRIPFFQVTGMLDNDRLGAVAPEPLLVKLNDMPSYEIFGKFYDAVMGDRSEAAERLTELIRETNPNAKNVLELGCGTGSMLKHLQDRYQVSGWIFRAECFQSHARKSLERNSSGKIWSILKSTSDST